MQAKKMFKVIAPIDRRDGGAAWWMRCGIAFLNKDDSINVILEALPLAGMQKGDGVKLQLREFTEAELRERAEKKANYQARAPYDPNGLPSSYPSRTYDPHVPTTAPTTPPPGGFGGPHRADGYGANTVGGASIEAGSRDHGPPGGARGAMSFPAADLTGSGADATDISF